VAFLQYLAIPSPMVWVGGSELSVWAVDKVGSAKV